MMSWEQRAEPLERNPVEPVTASFVPASPDLIWMVFIQQALVLIAWVIGLVVRRVLKNRMTMSTASATLTGLAGLWGGLVLAGWIFDSGDLWKPGMIGFAAVVAVLVVGAVAVVLARLNPRQGLPPISETAALGESETREFKSSARWNLRTGKRDEAMETVIAKTVSAFLNSGGGTLLIGVDDEGRLVGLDDDYATLKSPDADRFELWMRGMWGQRLGTNAAALPILDFASAPSGGEVCRVTIPPSPRPVYLLGPKGKGAPELWVRVGNSTRRLEVSDAVLYVSQRWPEAVRVSFWTRLRMYFLLRNRERPAAHLPRAVEEALRG